MSELAAGANPSGVIQPEHLAVAVASECPPEHMSGVSMAANRLLAYLDTAGHEALYICPRPAGDSINGARVNKRPSFPVPFMQFRAGIELGSRAIRRSLNAYDPDVVHAMSPLGLLGDAATKAAQELDMPLVASYQTDMPGFIDDFDNLPLGPFRPRLQQTAISRIERIHNRATINLVPTTEIIQQLVGYGADPATIRVVGRGVDTELHYPERRATERVQALRQAFSPEGQPIVGYLGRVAPEKRVHWLETLVDEDAALVVIGKGPSLPDIEERLGGTAHILGELLGEEKADALSTFDIMVHTGSKETFGQTLQEAGASGIPVVAPNAGGPRDIVMPGVTGFLYDPDDQRQMVEQVRTLIADADLRERMGAAAAELMQGRTWKTHGEQMVGIYRDAIEIHERTRHAGSLALAA